MGECQPKQSQTLLENNKKGKECSMQVNSEGLNKKSKKYMTEKAIYKNKKI